MDWVPGGMPYAAATPRVTQPGSGAQGTRAFSESTAALHAKRRGVSRAARANFGRLLRGWALAVRPFSPPGAR
jgi:hypothetical protein